MHAWLQRVWYDNAPSGLWLRPLSWLFGALAGLRWRLYRIGILRSYSVGIPVVVVGNITVGGTGKTPLTLWLAARIREAGFKVGIVMRGYQSHGGKPRLVNARDSYREVGDEAMVLARRSGVPVAVGADRVAAARLLVAQGVDVILADDGLQHLRLRRDFEIAVIDGARRFGNGRLLPAGPLREPVSRLSIVDAVVVNGSEAKDCLSMSLQPHGALPVIAGERQPLTAFKDSQVHALAAIGNPERFFRMLESQGLQVIRHPLPDHHALQRSDIEFGDNLPVLMTEKDAVKCLSFAGPQHWYVPVDAVLPEKDALCLLSKIEETMR